MARRKVSSTRVVSATDAVRNFGKLINEVRESRAVYVVERDGTPAVEIRPISTLTFTVGDLADLFRGGTRPDAAFGDAVEAAVEAANTPDVPRTSWRR